MHGRFRTRSRLVAIGLLGAAAAGLAPPGAAQGAPSAPQATAVEYFNSAFGHYFVTALPAEIAALDAGRFDQWSRTGTSFGVWNGGAGLDDVCRFFTTAFPPKSSHFYTPDPDECAKVKANPDWTFETIAFNTVRPGIDGGCPAFVAPLYRLYNRGQGGAPNHRYTTSLAVRAGMLQQGWIPEGYGDAGVIACVLPGVSEPPAIAPLRVTGNNPLPGNCDGVAPTGSLFAGAEVEPYLAVDPTNPDRLVGVWQQNRWSNGGAQALLAATSADGGRTWTASRARFSRCAGGLDERASDPWVSIGADGVVYQAALALTGQSFATGSSNAILVARSLDGGHNWDQPVTVRRDGADVFSDKESITADRADARFAYAVWDRLNRSGGGPLFFARTGDRGATWEPARVILDTPATAQTINNQIVVVSDGTLVNFYTWLQVTPPLNTTTGALRVLRSTDKGASWEDPVEIAKQQSLGVRDPDTGERVRDAAILGHVAAGGKGRLAAVWQDARFSGGARDGIAFSRSEDGGRSWTAPVQVNRVTSVPAFVPAVAIADDGTIGVTYYDFRNNTPDVNTLPTDYWIARSIDGGATWSETHVAGPFDLVAAPRANGLFLGDYMGLVTTGDDFVALFGATNTGNTANVSDIFAARVPGGPGAVGMADAIVTAKRAPELPPTPDFAAMLDDAIRAAMQRRIPGWVSPQQPLGVTKER
jgi:hypothetical protein